MTYIEVPWEARECFANQISSSIKCEGEYLRKHSTALLCSDEDGEGYLLHCVWKARGGRTTCRERQAIPSRNSLGRISPLSFPSSTLKCPHHCPRATSPEPAACCPPLPQENPPRCTCAGDVAAVSRSPRLRPLPSPSRCPLRLRPINRSCCSSVLVDPEEKRRKKRTHANSPSSSIAVHAHDVSLRTCIPIP